MYRQIVVFCFKFNILKNILTHKHSKIFALIMSQFSKICLIIFEINSFSNKSTYIFYFLCFRFFLAYVMHCVVCNINCDLLFNIYEKNSRSKIDCFTYFLISNRNEIQFVAFFKNIDENDKLIEKYQSNILINITNKMKTSLNFTKTIVIILMKFVYNSQLIVQIFKRTYRQKQKFSMYFYDFHEQIWIEKLINKTRLFTKILTKKIFENAKNIANVFMII